MPGAVGLTSVIFADAYTIYKFYLNDSPPVAALTTVHWHTRSIYRPAQKKLTHVKFSLLLLLEKSAFDLLVFQPTKLYPSSLSMNI